MARTSSHILAVCALAMFFLAGCQSSPAPAPPQNICYYLSSPNDLACVQRVIMVELASDVNSRDIAPAMTEALLKALQEARFCQIDLLRREEKPCEQVPDDYRRPYNLQELKGMRDAIGCDTVIIGGVSDFQPYPRMQIRLFLRMIDLKDGKLIWGVDSVWDTTDKTTECRLKEFFEDKMRSGYEPLRGRLGMISPAMFEKFVAYEVGQTVTPCVAGNKVSPVKCARRTLEKVCGNFN